MTIYDIHLDGNHDFYLDGQDLALAEEPDITAHRLTLRLQFLLAEWFLDNTVGVPYTQFIFLQGSSLEDIYSILQKEIRDTEGVENIASLELTPTPQEKSLRVDFSVNDGASTGTVEVTI